jgi:hypothetical protein
MSDTPIPTPGDVAPPAQATDAPEPEQKVDEIDWKAKAREWEKRAKDNKSAADRLAEIEAANQTEAEKAAARLAKAEQDALAARAEATRYRIATESKLSAEDAALLEHVTSEDGMRLIAKRLAGAESDKKQQGLHVPGEGKTPSSPGASDEREAVRGLFGG